VVARHDRGLARAGSGLPVCPAGVRLGEWLVVHGDGALPAGPLVLGHFHPCLRWGRGIAAPCYLVGDGRLVLPAFSPDAAGVNVLNGRRWRDYRCAAIAGADVLDFGQVGRLVDRFRGKSPRPRP
jgi:metallophosphoesterase superfamily enzyme